MLTDFHNSFVVILASKFATKSSLNIPPHLTNVGTLPCETLMSENSDNPTHIRFTTDLSFCLLVKEFLQSVNVSRSYRQNGDCFTCPVCPALYCLKVQNSPNDFCMMDKNVVVILKAD